MTPHGSVRRLVVTATIGSFALAALMGVTVLLGGDFGDGSARVLLTTLVVGLTSVAVLCYLATAETPYQPVGALGGWVVLLPLLTSLWLIWSEDGDGEATVKALGVGIVLAATLAQVSLLLAVAGTNRQRRPLLLAAITLAAGLALLICGVILAGDGDDGIWRAIGIVAILDVLATVVTMALVVVGKVASSPVTDGAGASVRLSPQLVQALDEQAETAGRTREDLVAEAVAVYLRTTTTRRTGD